MPGYCSINLYFCVSQYVSDLMSIFDPNSTPVCLLELCHLCRRIMTDMRNEPTAQMMLHGKLSQIKQIFKHISELSWQNDSITTALSIFDIIINDQRCVLKKHYGKPKIELPI